MTLAMFMGIRYIRRTQGAFVASKEPALVDLAGKRLSAAMSGGVFSRFMVFIFGVAGASQGRGTLLVRLVVYTFRSIKLWLLLVLTESRPEGYKISGPEPPGRRSDLS